MAPAAGSRPPEVASVLGRVVATARRHEMFATDAGVLVSVSGGADSLCLLHALIELRAVLRLGDVSVFHFDHRLRDDSADDARFVGEVADGLEVTVHEAHADDAPAKGDSVEDWAHRARSAALAEALEASGAAVAAVGHTRDDRAETVLLAAIRGGGAEALAGIRPVSGRVVRPLIDLARSETESFCAALDLRPRDDPSNADTSLLRNALRLEAIPALERVTGRDVKAPLARTSELLREDAIELARLSAAAFDQIVEEQEDGFAIDAEALMGLPVAMASRIARDVLYRAGTLPSAELVDALLDLGAGRPGRRRDLPGHSTATRDREYVHVPRSSPGGRS